MKNKKHEMLILIMTIGITISGCVTEKRIATRPPIKCQSTIKSKSLDWQQEQVMIMRSWTQEQRDEFRREYVYSEVNLFLKNGDTLVVK
jgi:hypothetical protein